MAHDVFISYSSKDKTVADAVCARLEAAGIRCWVAPRDILPGSDWGAAIIDAIEGCHTMVLLFSASSNVSDQVNREIQNAVGCSIPILPIRIEAVQPSKSLRYFIGIQHWLDAVTPPLEQHLDRLVTTVSALLSLGLDAGSPRDIDTHSPKGAEDSRLHLRDEASRHDLVDRTRGEILRFAKSAHEIYMYLIIAALGVGVLAWLGFARLEAGLAGFVSVGILAEGVRFVMRHVWRARLLKQIRARRLTILEGVEVATRITECSWSSVDTGARREAANVIAELGWRAE